MRKSKLLTKVAEKNPKRFFRHRKMVSRPIVVESNSNLWQAGGKAKFVYLPPGFNNDPCLKRNEHVKSEVIDLETYDYAFAA